MQSHVEEFYECVFEGKLGWELGDAGVCAKVVKARETVTCTTNVPSYEIPTYQYLLVLSIIVFIPFCCHFAPVHVYLDIGSLVSTYN